MPVRNTRNGINLEVTQETKLNKRRKGKKIILEGGSFDYSGGDNDDDEYDDEYDDEDDDEKDDEKKEKEKDEKAAKGSKAEGGKGGK